MAVAGILTELNILNYSYKSTSLRIYLPFTDLYDQKGRTAIITGGNRGIGLHVVEKLLACHITVVMGVRNVETSQRAVFAAIPEDRRRNLLHFETLDTGNLKSVRDFAATIKAKYSKIDLLINNGTFYRLIQLYDSP